MKKYIFYLLFIISTSVFAQAKKTATPFAAVDSLYREDQFFLGLTYNTLMKTPVDINQNGLSLGVTAGFLRDFPINKSRTVAIAIGLGASYNKFHQNLRVSNQNGTISYRIIGNEGYDRNKLEQVTLDMPIEFRWRNSTPTRYDFLRIYTGFKFGYLLYNKTLYVGDDATENVQNNSDFNKFQYGPTISVGYNTWNLHAYYGLQPIFGNAVLNEQKVKMATLNIGLIFYIL